MGLRKKTRQSFAAALVGHPGPMFIGYRGEPAISLQASCSCRACCTCYTCVQRQANQPASITQHDLEIRDGGYRETPDGKWNEKQS
jgi:hypothetical protein